MLPKDLFINLIDTELQQRIANCITKDKDATDAITTLLKEGPTSMQNQLDDWTLESFEGKNILSSKEKTISHRTKNYAEILPECFMIVKWQVTPGSLKPSMPYANTIGGPACELSSRTTSLDAESVSNLKSTDRPPNRHYPHRRSQINQTICLLFNGLHNRPPLDQ